MKKFIAVLLVTIFACGTFASYATDIGSKAKTELTKKSIDLVCVEQATTIEVDAPAIQPLNHITGSELNVKAFSRPWRAVVNAPPLKLNLENSPHAATRIRAVTGINE